MIVAVLGVGTGIGKTAATAAWLRHLRERGRRVAGWKAIESGGDGDERALAEACGERLPAMHRFEDPVSPHLGARKRGVHIAPEALERRAKELATPRDALIVELAGGAFSPLTDDGLTNADAVVAWGDHTILVASDRLGVLHDVEACRRAGLRFDALFLTRGTPADGSRASNEGELRRFCRVPVIAGDFVGTRVAGLQLLDGWFG